MFSPARMISTLALTWGLSICASAVSAQSVDMQTTYATKKGGCAMTEKLVTISQGNIAGPGFECTLSNPSPAGTGMEAYDSVCSVDGAEVTEVMAFDLGNNRDHFAVAIPGRDGWMDLYPCTKVPGLEQ
ncbi:hypothetical protein OEG84_14640 [Hoeflea sp. G2-23]|uniref:Uncharacterized protein n=1 Tax=Hoeflea algicola TaxID=2983763 RepID=A0ABT3ZB88_9HYPH|nr:hypothetical protein [Hoeflea algicola]MCY0148906.1 hypothetical protein [Hoeflea algicola]